jgi:hypothetical protein
MVTPDRTSARTPLGTKGDENGLAVGLSVSDEAGALDAPGRDETGRLDMGAVSAGGRLGREVCGRVGRGEV